MTGNGMDPAAVAARVQAMGTATAVAAGITPKQLRVESETLSTFKKRVDHLLWQLEKSEAAPKNIADGVLPAGDLGDFNEAESLRGAYRKVHGQLENLSKMLGLQIEALLTAVDASKAGYQNMDEEVRAQLSRIRTETDAIVDGWRDRGGHEREQAPASESADKVAGGL
ncbi:hypothetical protein QIS99_27195 [Streptomyces sp. B-S-A8]|uniref:Type VII secretion system-associated protein n=1 Tax=Streptomyces solicavernae TaxID=3043614 RepID=A0ABT6RZJ1_9ACTN|nr:hypothetical protein [Streptomyces sp. B-S-A8]MDI3389849.1 hypothetical protein [Streptomyces sp. B-S-A8]